MGSCCAGEIEDGKSQMKTGKNKNQTSKGEGFKGQTGGAAESGEISDFCNEKVLGIYHNLKPYSIPAKSDS